MRRFTDAGRHCFAAGIEYAGLFIALSLPDICAALENQTEGRRRYIEWYRRWAEPSFRTVVAGTPRLLFSAEDCYGLRCSILHSGSSLIDKRRNPSGIDEVWVSEAAYTSTRNTLENINDGSGTLKKIFQVKAIDLGHAIFDAVDAWDVAKAGNATVLMSKERLLKLWRVGEIVLPGFPTHIS